MPRVEGWACGRAPLIKIIFNLVCRSDGFVLCAAASVPGSVPVRPCCNEPRRKPNVIMNNIFKLKCRLCCRWVPDIPVTPVSTRILRLVFLNRPGGRLRQLPLMLLKSQAVTARVLTSLRLRVGFLIREAFDVNKKI